MRGFSRSPVLRVTIVIAVAFLAVLALSACLARSSPTPRPPTPAQAKVEPTVAPEPTKAPAEPTKTPEPTQAPDPTAQPGAVDLAVSAWHEETIAPGARVTYRVAYANYDLERAAAGVALKVTLPEGAALAASSRDGQPFPPQATANALEYSLGTLKAGEQGEIGLAVQMPGKLAPGARLALTARIAGSAPDPDEDNNHAEDAERIPAPHLTVAVRPSDECGPFVPGRAVSYLLSYGNASQVEAASVVLTSTLSKGMTFRSAHRLLKQGKAAISPNVQGSQITFELGAVAPNASGDILVEVDLDKDISLDQPLTCTVGIATTSGELNLEDNLADDVQYAQVAGPDVWVKMDRQSDGELGGTHTYRVHYGNRGTADAGDVVVSLAIPSALKDVTFSTAPATFAGGTATWKVGKLQASTSGEPIEVRATIGDTGQAVARATVNTSSRDVNPRNDAAEATDDLVAVHMPTITGPSAARVGAQPVFFGLGKPAATVSLYLASTESQPGRLLGTGLVGGDGRWEIAPTSGLPQPGWYWFTATQQLGGLVSPVTGVANYYSDGIAIDTNSLTVNGKRVGGIDQTIDWVEESVLTFGARIVTCDNPLTPTLRARYYNAQGQVTNHRMIEPKLTRPDGYVEFDFQVPRVDQEVEWQLELGFYCRGGAQTFTIGRSPGLASPQKDLLGKLKKKIDCWFGGCSTQDPPPPPPPQPCQGCTPLPRKPMPKPDKDKGGFGRPEPIRSA